MAEAWEQARAAGLNPELPPEVAQAYKVYDESPPKFVQPRRQSRRKLTSTLNRTLVYTYDSLYRLTEADYSTGELYEYEYDAVGNRLQQIISGDTTDYLYDAANRLESINGVSVSYDANGNLLTNSVMTNTWDSANRLISTLNQNAAMVNHYDGLGNRVGRTQDGQRIDYALDVAVGLPEVVYTSEGHKYLHLPGVIMTESDTGEVRYLLGDVLGSVRHVVDEAGVVVAYKEYDPYGNPVVDDESGYAFTGEWFERDIGLLHLRARWYSPEMGTFLSKDPWQGSRNGYNYVNSNPTNLVDPLGWYSCNPITGRCEDGRYLCSVVGTPYYGRDQYGNRKACIVNPNNVSQNHVHPYTPAPPLPVTTLAMMPRYPKPMTTPMPDQLADCYCEDWEQMHNGLIRMGYPTTLGIVIPDLGWGVDTLGGYEGGVGYIFVFNWYSGQIGVLPNYSSASLRFGTPEGASIGTKVGLFLGHGGTNIQSFGGPARIYYGEVSSDTIAQFGGEIEMGVGVNNDGSVVYDPYSQVPVWYETVSFTAGFNMIPNIVDAKLGYNPGQPALQGGPGSSTNHTYSDNFINLHEWGLVGKRRNCIMPPGAYQPPFIPYEIWKFEKWVMDNIDDVIIDYHNN